MFFSEYLVLLWNISFVKNGGIFCQRKIQDYYKSYYII